MLLNSQISTTGVLYNILRLKAVRMLNKLFSFSQIGRKRKADAPVRTGTPRKKRFGILFAIMIFGWLSFSAFGIAFTIIQTLGSKINAYGNTKEFISSERENSENFNKSVKNGDTANAVLEYNNAREIIREKLGFGGSAYQTRPFFTAAAFVMALIFLVVLFWSLGSTFTGMSQGEFEFEWLLSMPAPIPAICAARILQQAVLNVFGWIVFPAFSVLLLMFWGYGWLAVPAAIAITLTINLLIAGITAIIELTGYKRFSTGKLKAIWALSTLAGTVIFFLVLSLNSSVGRTDYFLYGWIRDFGVITEYLPTGLALGIFRADSASGALLKVLLLAGQIILVLSGISYIISAISAQGLEAMKMETLRGKASGKLYVIQSFGIVGKDLKLLRRDASRIIGLLLAPFIIIIQLLFSPETLKKALDSPLHWGAISFGIGMYSLITSAINLIFDEKDALWMFYTFPHTIEKMILRKLWFWSILAMFYASVAFGIGIYWRGGFSAQDAQAVVWILLGLPVFGIIGASIGVIGADPLATEVKERMRQEMVYLYMMLGGLFGAGLYLPGLWSKGVVLFMFCVLAVALWQKVTKQAGYLLDPSAMPQRKTDLADGLISVVVFFFLQALAAVICAFTGMEKWSSIGLSYATAGAITVIFAFLMLWRSKAVTARGVLRAAVKFDGFPSSLLFALVAGVIASGAGIAYAALISRIPSLKQQAALMPEDFNLWMIAVVVIAAPFFEEIIFRGMVFRGLRQTRAFYFSAILSALIFAAVHPQISAIPVFCLGLATAWIYEKTGNLIFPMIVHAVYNGAILTVSWAINNQVIRN